MTSNPWLKTNPFLSMWLSGVNAMLGASRGIITAEASRQAAVIINEYTRLLTEFWLATLMPPGMSGSRRRR